MYEPNTILELKEPRSTEDKPFPYDRVKVIGQSPIDHATGATSGWEGVNSQGVIITPLTDFASTLDEPLGKLQALYDVAEVPEVVVDAAPQVRIVNSRSAAAGPTPEEVFAKEAPGVADPDGGRARTPFVSPLDDPRPNPEDGPLGPA